MKPTADRLRREAEDLRAEAAELVEDNPTAAEYHERRAAWVEYLARKRDEEGGGA